MAWQDEMGIMLRVMVSDNGTTQTYSDDDIENSICLAARLVQMKADFPVSYAVNVENATIVPDPTVGDNRDENFINLVCLQGACVLDRGSALRAAGQAIMIRDGSSQIDLRDTFKAKLALIEKGWCAVYAETLDDYLVNQKGTTVGAAILTPFRIYANDYAMRYYR